MCCGLVWFGSNSKTQTANWIQPTNLRKKLFKQIQKESVWFHFQFFWVIFYFYFGSVWIWIPLMEVLQDIKLQELFSIMLAYSFICLKNVTIVGIKVLQRYSFSQRACPICNMITWDGERKKTTVFFRFLNNIHIVSTTCTKMILQIICFFILP